MNAKRSNDEIEWEEAMDVWRDDVYRRASRLDPAVLTDRILRQPGPAGRGREETAALRYAAAAVLLVGFGLAGSLWIGSRPLPSAVGGIPSSLRAVEDGRLALEGDRAALDFDTTAARRAEEER